MRKLFTLCILSVFALTSMTAQNYVFVNAAGDVVEDGSTITVTDVHDDGFGGIELKSGLSVKNVGAPSNYSVRVHNEITQIDNGNVQVCFPVFCHNYTTVGKNKSEEGKLATDEVKDIQSEWFPEAYGECVVTYTAMALQPMANLFIEKGGPKVTVHYVYADHTGVKSVKSDARPAGCYDLQGRQSVRPVPGINIVRMGNGSVRKIFSR